MDIPRLMVVKAFIWFLGVVLVGHTTHGISGQTEDRNIGQTIEGNIEQTIEGNIGQTIEGNIEQTKDRHVRQTTGDKWDWTAQTLCPALNLCQKPSLQNISTPAGKQLCCAQCSCDRSCWLYNNCCPDVDVPQLETERRQLPCRNTRYRAGPKQDLARYRIIGSCPSGFTNTDVIYKCGRETSDLNTFGEIVAVSNAHDHDQIYRNKFCAACNGVHAIVNWVLILYKCISPMANLDLRGSEVIPRVMRDCILYSIPPIDLQLTYKSKCWDTSKCNYTGKWRIYDPYLEHACQMSAFPVYDVRGTAKFRNVFCYICNYPDVTLASDMCEAVYEQKFKIPPFSDIMDLNDDYGGTEIATGHRCAVDEMYCPILGACRRLYCPAFTYVHFSECRALWMKTSDHTIEVRLKIDFNQTCSPSCIKQIADDNMKDSISRVLNVSFTDDTKCSVCFYYILLPHGSDMNSTITSLSARIKVSSYCQYEMIGKRIQLLGDNVTSYTVVIDGRLIQVVISLDIASKSTTGLLTERILASMRNGLNYCITKSAVLITYKMAYCAHFVLNSTEYTEYVREVKGVLDSNHRLLPDKNKYIWGVIKMDTPDEECHECSEDQVYICTDTYLRNYPNRSGEPLSSRANNALILMALIVLRYVEKCYFRWGIISYTAAKFPTGRSGQIKVNLST